MSYKPLENSEDLSEFFSNMFDCLAVCKRMKEASGDFESCISWFLKAMQINIRHTILYINDNVNSFTEDENKYFSGYINKIMKGVSRD